MRTARQRFALLIGLLASALAAAEAPRQAEVEQKLAAVRVELQAVQQRQQALDGERGALEDALRGAERELSRATRTVREREADVIAQQAALQALEGLRGEMQVKLDGQRAGLEALVRAVYALGRHEQIKLLLAQDSIDQLNRRLAYHRYLQRDRLQRVSDLLAALADLARASQAVATQAAVAETAQREAVAAVDALQQRRIERGKALAALEAELGDNKTRLRALGRDESALTALLSTLKDVLADIPRQLEQSRALAQQRGQLPMPADGKLRVGYAGTLPDGRPSSGWWIEVARGSEVRAVAHGRAAFADWMKGYGLLLIVDHGEGYMSLYAGGEALLVAAGDWVEPGQVVAIAGESGGFPAPGVYFELRRGARPLDPATWLRRK